MRRTAYITVSKGRACAVAMGALLTAMQLTAQDSRTALSLDSCQAWAAEHHPTARRYAIAAENGDASASNAAKGRLPQLMLAGQASIQSAATHVPLTLPGFELPEVAKDQYRIYAEAVQPLTGLLTVRDNVRLAHANAAAERSRIDVEMHALKVRVNALFFGILMLDEQARMAELMTEDLRVGIARADTAAAHGVMLRSAADALRAELIVAEQRLTEVRATRENYVSSLGLLVGRELEGDVALSRPTAWPTEPSGEIRRPELRLFEAQKASIDVNRRLLHDVNLPHISLFVQGGYGRPALNMLDNNFKPYAVGGLRMSWNIAGLYTLRKQKRQLELNARAVDVQHETFLLETKLTLNKHASEMEKLRRLIASDAEVIRLRERVKESARNQLQFGTATANDYILHVNAENRARLGLAQHELQLLWEAYNYQMTLGE